MSGLKYPLKIFTFWDALKIAENIYGIRGTVKNLPGDRDQNFYLKSKTNKEYKLKIAHPGESRSILDLQNKTMNFLKKASPEHLCPQVFPAKDGSEIIRIEGKNGQMYLVCLFSYLKGTPLAEFRPHTSLLLQRVGKFMGKMDYLLRGFSHPGARRSLVWDLNQAGFIKKHLSDIPSGKKRSLIKHFLRIYEEKVVPHLSVLRCSIIQNDGNDHNILIRYSWPNGSWVSGIVDFGDMVYTQTVNEIAITAAYALMHKDDLLDAAYNLVKGFNQSLPLSDKEIEVIYPLICIRLCISVTLSEIRKLKEPENEYLVISEKPAWALLENLSNTNEKVFHYTLRQACGKSACPQTPVLVSWLKKNKSQFGSLIEPGWNKDKTKVLNLGISSPDLNNLKSMIHHRDHTEIVKKIMESDHQSRGIGRYLEARLWESLNLLRKKKTGEKNTQYSPGNRSVCSGRQSGPCASEGKSSQ